MLHDQDSWQFGHRRWVSWNLSTRGSSNPSTTSRAFGTCRFGTLLAIGLMVLSELEVSALSTSFHVKIQRHRSMFSWGTWCRKILETVSVANQLLTSLSLAFSNIFLSEALKLEIFTSLLCLLAADTGKPCHSVWFLLSSGRYLVGWYWLQTISLVFLQDKTIFFLTIQTSFFIWSFGELECLWLSGWGLEFLQTFPAGCQRELMELQVHHRVVPVSAMVDVWIRLRGYAGNCSNVGRNLMWLNVGPVTGSIRWNLISGIILKVSVCQVMKLNSSMRRDDTGRIMMIIVGKFWGISEFFPWPRGSEHVQVPHGIVCSVGWPRLCSGFLGWLPA